MSIRLFAERTFISEREYTGFPNYSVQVELLSSAATCSIRKVNVIVFELGLGQDVGSRQGRHFFIVFLFLLIFEKLTLGIKISFIDLIKTISRIRDACSSKDWLSNIWIIRGLRIFMQIHISHYYRKLNKNIIHFLNIIIILQIVYSHLS